ncbi:MAG: methyltransferase domain-containing protein [Nitrospinae bacterium]|nr:methyltransferase domain-containing protein [Nitrospinota bacterium]
MKPTRWDSGRESRIVESFSRRVRSYDKHAHLQKAMAERLASLLPSPLPDTVLEVGCGTGLFTRHLLARSVRSLILNDIAPAMIDRLREEMDLPENSRIVVGNVEISRFPKVDLIVANAVFQWLQNPEETLARLAGRLSPSGRIAFSVFGPRTLAEFRETGSLESPILLFPLARWKKILQRAGFQILEAHSEIRQVFFPGALAMIKNLQQIGAAPLKMLEAGGLRSLIRKYDAAFSTPQGVYSTWELFYFSGTRSGP